MKTSEMIDQISTAMALAQGETTPALKMTINPFFKSKYASLTSIWEAVKNPLARNKLSVFQELTSTERGVAVTTRICHSSGQWMEFGPLDIPSTKKDAQGLGSAASYGRRYALAAALGVVSDEDDDANEASKPVIQKPAEQVKKISELELIALDELIGEDKEFRKNVTEFLKKQFGCISLVDMPANIYPQIMKRAQANKEKEQCE